MSSSNTPTNPEQNLMDGNPVVLSAKRQLGQAIDIAEGAVMSGAWAYPLLGVSYLLTHPTLMRPLVPSLLKGAVMSIAVVASMFFLTYLPQVAALAVVSGPLAFAAAIPLVLGEAYVVINFLTRTFVLGQIGIDLFDAVLVQKGQAALVERGRQITDSGGKTKQLGQLITKPLSRFNLDSLVRYVISLPLNFVPVVGTVAFLGFNGYKAGPGFHGRYFQLKGYDREERMIAVQRRRGAYAAFGTTAMVLNLIPLASTFFSFTSIVGAALWAAGLESNDAPSQSGTAQVAEVDVAMLANAAKKDL